MANFHFANSPEDLPSFEETKQLTGLEYMQKTIAGEIAAPAIAKTMNFRLVSVAKGQAVFRGVPEFKTTNPAGTPHGGWFGAIMDSAMACAAMTEMPAGVTHTTLEYKININRVIPLGMEVECIGQVTHAGRSTVVATCELRGVEDNRIYATGSTTCLVLKL